MKPSGIGGQAVMEGVMMKNKDIYAVAVRKSNKEIVVEKSNYVSFAEKYKIFKFPILRGILSFIESMVIGMKTLTFSASFFEEEEEKPSRVETTFTKVFKEKAESVIMGITVVLSIAVAVAIFMMLPYVIAEFLQGKVESPILLAVMEGVIRMAIFIAYVVGISQMKDIRRTFMYHGAEHKTINCLEQGFPLNIKNVKMQSKVHKRCGTSFVFLVMFISIIFFIFIRVDTIWLRIVVRLLLVPVIAGVAYEFIRFAGRNDSLIVQVISKPGLMLQGLTTREPDEDMIEVAIKSVESVFDWKSYLTENNIEFDEVETDQSENKSVAKRKKNNSKKKKADINKTLGATQKPESVKIVKHTEDIEETEVMEEITSTEEMVESEEIEKIEESNKPKFSIYFSTGTEEEDPEEEEDEILRALDRYFTVNNNKEDEKH